MQYRVLGDALIAFDSDLLSPMPKRTRRCAGDRANTRRCPPVDFLKLTAP